MRNIRSRDLMEVPFTAKECRDFVPKLLALTERDQGTLEGDYLTFLAHRDMFLMAHLFYYCWGEEPKAQCVLLHYKAQLTPLVSTFVHPEHRRKGIAADLLKTARHTYPTLALRACTNDRESAGFYQKFADEHALILVDTYRPGTARTI